MSEELERRKSLSFEQAEGFQEIPRQMKQREIPREFRALLWSLIYNSLMKSSYGGEVKAHWRIILEDLHVRKMHRAIDEFDDSLYYQSSVIKSVIFHSDYVVFFGLLQFLIRNGALPSELIYNLQELLVECRMGYRIVEKTIMPLSSEQETDSFRIALIESASTPGAQTHLRQAAEACTNGAWADSVRESIHAVESAARTLAPGAQTLDPALAELERAGKLNAALRRGFGALYGFTSSEQGIRHALLDKDESAVDEADALFMLGACAAFVTYLLRKASQ